MHGARTAGEALVEARSRCHREHDNVDVEGSANAAGYRQRLDDMRRPPEASVFRKLSVSENIEAVLELRRILRLHLMDLGLYKP